MKEKNNDQRKLLHKLMQKFLDHAKNEVSCLHIGISSPVIEPYPYWTSPTWKTLVLTEHAECLEYLTDAAPNVQVCHMYFAVDSPVSKYLLRLDKLEQMFDFDLRSVNLLTIDVREEDSVLPLLSKTGLYPDVILIFHPAKIAEWHVTYDALQNNIPLDYNCNYYGPTITAYVHRAV